MNKEDMQKLVVGVALNMGLDPALVCSICHHESGNWKQYASRYEPAFFAKYVESTAQTKTFGPTVSQATERKDRATSFGLMQIMGLVAREYGYQEEYLSGLFDPTENALWGCKRLKHALDKNGGSVPAALLDYNGGGDANYPSMVMGHYPDYAYLNSGVMK